jgi:hypothetical protein
LFKKPGWAQDLYIGYCLVVEKVKGAGTVKFQLALARKGYGMCPFARNGSSIATRKMAENSFYG